MVVPFLLHALHLLPSPLRGGLPLSREANEGRPAVGRVWDSFDQPLPLQRRDQQARGVRCRVQRERPGRERAREPLHGERRAGRIRTTVADIRVGPEPVLQEVVLHRDAGGRGIAVLLLLGLERVVRVARGELQAGVLAGEEQLAALVEEVADVVLGVHGQAVDARARGRVRRR